MMFDSETMKIYTNYGVFCGLLETVSISMVSSCRRISNGLIGKDVRES